MNPSPTLLRSSLMVAGHLPPLLLHHHHPVMGLSAAAPSSPAISLPAPVATDMAIPTMAGRGLTTPSLLVPALIPRVPTLLPQTPPNRTAMTVTSLTIRITALSWPAMSIMLSLRTSTLALRPRIRQSQLRSLDRCPTNSSRLRLHLIVVARSTDPGDTV